MPLFNGRSASRGIGAGIGGAPASPAWRSQHTDESLYPKPSRELSARRRELAPDPEAAFRAFSRAVFQSGALPRKTKELIAVAVAHVTQCPYCIQGHTRAAAREGASNEEIMEAIWVASEMRAGAAFAHSAIALANLPDDDAGKEPGPAG